MFNGFKQKPKMKSLMLSIFQFLSLTALLAVSPAATTPFNIPRLSPIRRYLPEQQEISEVALNSGDLETFYYNQTLDHFNYRPESYSTFRQRYLISSRHWGGPDSPIFAYLGNEAPIDGDLIAIGFLNETAPRFKALQIYIEHRFYGESKPFNVSKNETIKNLNADERGYFNSAQAIADYAEILLYVKKTLHAEHSPIIVIGGSYGGMLASWFRLKYPHIALGALASSAPILYFDDIKLTPPGGYASVVTNDFREASETCYQTIVDSWNVIDKVASEPNGLVYLSEKFQTCETLKNASELKDYLIRRYWEAAQYDQPPQYPVTILCGGMDGGSSSGNETDNVLSRIFAGLVAYIGNQSCYINPPSSESEIIVGWSWQTCSEMVIPMGNGNDTMFQPNPFILSDFERKCKDQYGVVPRPHWITSYFGGHDIKLILKRFGSNIIFSNGLRDPWSSGGVLESISSSILAVKTKNGSHCLDIVYSSETDPQWLVEQRKTEVNIIQQWLYKYYADVERFLKNN